MTTCVDMSVYYFTLNLVMKVVRALQKQSRGHYKVDNNLLFKDCDSSYVNGKVVTGQISILKVYFGYTNEVMGSLFCFVLLLLLL